MNYGKFFRLNKNLSRIEEGYAVYDYIDLPAYFTRSMDNQMSPKYPVSMTVLADSVAFKLHYSAYKIEESSDVLPDLIDTKYPKYLYDIKDKTQNGGDSLKSGDVTKIVHMEETILELPYTDTVGRNLSDTIRDIYNTNFPLISNVTDESDSNTIKLDSSGGRFLRNLIRKRYLDGDVEEKRDIHSHFYHSLRRISDGTPSYSTLWLMGLVMGDKDIVRCVLTDKKGNIVGFLRKLLLDFMFDLKHSDVFQNSADYQKMYSGLMSNFYFSALMHKCEYYYYRKLTSKAIEDIDNEANSEVQEKRIKTIGPLYATELVKAEDLWIQDIMNSQAEKCFEHKYPGKHNVLREFIEHYSFRQWPSWFAEPEEEMRRVCFTMKDETGERHICNADTLISYLNLIPNSEDWLVRKMIDLRDDNKEKISKWFLKQYAFSDVFHLHLFKHSNSLFLWLIALPCLASLFSGAKFLPWFFLFLFALVAFLLLVYLVTYHISFYKSNLWDLSSCLDFRKKKLVRESIYSTRLVPKTCKTKLVHKRNEIILARVLFVVASLCGLVVLLCLRNDIPLYGFIGFVVLLMVPHLLMTTGNINQRFSHLFRQIIAGLHLLLPRLVASISLAWITLSMGFDLYVSYFDCRLNWYYIICISIIVVVFVMYEINRIAPHSSPLRKFLRSLELLIISYFISLFVGAIVINFLGEKYLERGGYMQEYYEQFVNYDGFKKIRLDVDSINRKYSHKENKNVDNNAGVIPIDDSLYTICSDIYSEVKSDTNDFSRKLVDSLVYVYRVKESALLSNRDSIQYIAAKEKFWGTNVFILRNFLIMFAFIAMFTGIFIQLIIFGDNKQMTEL